MKIVGMVIGVAGAVLPSFTNSMESSKETSSSGGGLGGHKNLIVGPVNRSLVIMAHPATESP